MRNPGAVASRWLAIGRFSASGDSGLSDRNEYYSLFSAVVIMSTGLYPTGIDLV